jgi:hypothetical protein
MAIQTKINGNTKPVFAIDTLGGSGSNPTGTPVMFSGPKLDFFGIDLGADPAGQLDSGEAVEAVITCITQLATTHFYQVQASAAANNMSIAVYPTAAWTAADLQAAIRALGTVATYDLSGAVVTNVGFKLAAS